MPQKNGRKRRFSNSTFDVHSSADEAILNVELLGQDILGADVHEITNFINQFGKRVIRIYNIETRQSDMLLVLAEPEKFSN